LMDPPIFGGQIWWVCKSEIDHESSARLKSRDNSDNID